MLFWNKRLWLLGLLLGNGAGLLLLLSGNPITRRFLETAFPYTAFGYYTGDFLLALGLGLGGFVFPAILTCLARRFYALWGLLPICLLVLWIVTGKALNHTLPNLFNPFWPLPLVIFLCWAISCGSISLFRFVRQKYFSRPAVAPMFGPPRRRRRLLPALLLVFLALVGLGTYNRKYPLTKEFVFSATCPLDHPIRVPLLKQGAKLLVKVNNHTDDEALFQLDTGSTSVSWPRNLCLTGKPLGTYSENCDVLGACVKGRTIVLPQLQIGNYRVVNLPTEMSDTTNGLFCPPAQEDSEPLLGNPAFTRTVLTVDYKNAMLTIQNPAYDFTHQSRKAGDYVLEMGWQSNYSDKEWQNSFYGTPAIQVAVNGAPLWCTLDTGWGGPEMGLTRNFVDKHPAISRARRDRMPLNAANSSAEINRLHDLHLTIPCFWPPHAKPIALKVDAAVTPTLAGGPPEGSAMIGLTLMERYRITIDYGRGRILLEPYDRAVPGQKQEKVGAGAKQ